MLTGNSREALQTWAGAKPIGLIWQVPRTSGTYRNVSLSLTLDCDGDPRPHTVLSWNGDMYILRLSGGGELVVPCQEWVHLALVFDAASMTVSPYVDTEMAEPVHVAAPPAPRLNDAGTGSDCPASSFRGYLDEVYLVNRAVSAAEVVDMYLGQWMGP